MLEIFLSKKYRVFLAADGQAALELVKQDNPDFIITDVNMPKMNGDELARQVFALNPSVPFLIISGVDINQNREYPSNVIKFLEKPFKVKDLTDLMSEHFK
jgi:YesN/AraC family two-component response regulator